MLHFNNVLIPADFSDCSKAAFHASIDLARRFDIKIHLLHVFNPASGLEGEPLTIMGRTPPSKQLIEHLLTAIDRIYKTEKYQHISITNHVRTGKFVVELNTTCDQLGIDMVLMGSHGVSGKTEYFLGSNAQKAVRKLHLPIFIIKDAIEIESLRQVVYVTSPKAMDHKSFQCFIDFLTLLPVKKLHLLTVDLPGYFGHKANLEMSKLAGMVKQHLDCEFASHRIKQFTVESGVRQFVYDHKIDLVGIDHHDRHPIKRLFSGSNVEFLVNHLEIPLLSLDY